MNIEDVFYATSKVIRNVRELQRPVFLEAKTYRFRAHSMFDAELYRDKEEVERWRDRDPIKLFKEKMQAAGFLEEADLATYNQDAREEVERAIAFATESEWEPIHDLDRFVYSDKESDG